MNLPHFVQPMKALFQVKNKTQAFNGEHAQWYSSALDIILNNFAIIVWQKQFLCIASYPLIYE